nr:MAG TPA: hypothetical protein [Caudoviricetes sp.]
MPLACSALLCLAALTVSLSLRNTHGKTLPSVTTGGLLFLGLL